MVLSYLSERSPSRQRAQQPLEAEMLAALAADQREQPAHWLRKALVGLHERPLAGAR